MFKHHLKISFRNLWKYKVYSAINLAGLAIGMACCILILLWVQDELSYDKFHKNADRIFRIILLDREDPSRGIARAGAPWGPALKKDYPEIDNFVRFRFFGRSLVSCGDKQFYEDEGLYADSTIFQVFSFPLVKGDSLTALNDPKSVVINEDLAAKYFGDEDPLGKTLTFDNQVERQVTGVLKNVPENSHMYFEFLLPFSSYQRWDLTEWTVNNFHIYLLLKEKAQALELEAKMPKFVIRHMNAEKADQSIVKLQPLTDIHLHSNLHREFQANGDITYVYMFSLIALFILLIACINFMNLTTAKSANRAKEVGIRKVVGSQRMQLIKQFLGESILLSILAIILAIGLSEILLPYFVEYSGKTVALNIGSNLLFTLSLVGIALMVGLLSGAYPAFFLSSFRPVAVMKGHRSVFCTPGGVKREFGNRSWLRKVLVIVQFTISIALIIGTAVVYKQLDFISERKLGFDKEQVVVVRMSDSNVLDRYESFKNELLQNPSILNVSATSNLLGGGDWGMPLYIQNENGEEKFISRVLIVDHDFVETLQMKIVQGRDFSTEFATDLDEAFLLNETAVKQLGWQQPLGKAIKRVQGQDEEGKWIWKNGRVVGVVKDFHFRSLHHEILPMVMYIVPEWFKYLSVRIQSGKLTETVSFIERKWQTFEPNRPFDCFFLDESFGQMYRAEKRFAQIFGAFSILAILIACLGLFGLASFVAEQRTKEIGIRKVLGATVSNIVLQLSKDFTKWTVLSNIVAWPVAFWTMNRWLEDFAYRIELGFGEFFLAGILALGIALFTVSFQSIKAALANPVDALKYE